MIYFIKVDEYVKIGFTKNVNQRIKNLQTGNHRKLELLCEIEGGYYLEKQYHDYFQQYRQQGEWFEYRDELYDTIQILIHGGELPKELDPLAYEYMIFAFPTYPKSLTKAERLKHEEEVAQVRINRTVVYPNTDRQGNDDLFMPLLNRNWDIDIFLSHKIKQLSNHSFPTLEYTAGTYVDRDQLLNSVMAQLRMFNYSKDEIEKIIIDNKLYVTAKMEFKHMYDEAYEEVHGVKPSPD